MAFPTINIEGTVVAVFDVEQKSDRFSVQRIWLVDDPIAPRQSHVEIQAINDHVAEFDGIEVNDRVSMPVQIVGRKWEPSGRDPRVFNSLQLSGQVNLIGGNRPATNLPEDDDAPF